MNRIDSCTTQAFVLSQALRLCANVCMPCMSCDLYFREVSFFSAASQCSLFFYGVSMLRYLTANNCDSRPPGLEATTSALDYVPLLPYLFFVRFYMCMGGWMTVSRQRNCYTKPTPSSTEPQTFSSPVQVTQPSSTQDSFAKSNGPALFSLVSFCLASATLSWAGSHCFHCLHKVKMVDGG